MLVVSQSRLSEIMSKQQVRVFLWAVPRSISTAFFRAMMNKTNCKVCLSLSRLLIPLKLIAVYHQAH